MDKFALTLKEKLIKTSKTNGYIMMRYYESYLHFFATSTDS